MKNTMKALLCLLALLVTTTLWVSAAEGNGQYTYEVGDTVYTVEFEDSALSAEQQEAVIQPGDRVFSLSPFSGRMEYL